MFEQLLGLFGLFGIKVDVKDLQKLVKDNFPKLKNYIKMCKTMFFYDEDLIKIMLSVNDFKSKEKSTKYIKYENAYIYYPEDKCTMSIVYNDSEMDISLPYSEVINFITKPDAKIFVDGVITDFNMSDSVERLTADNLRSYLSDNPGTSDGSILRISSLTEESDSAYKCKLERSSYYYQVRTNLTLDLPLQSKHEKTLRVIDLNEKKGLRPFTESIMVNSIGVSACIYFRDSRTGKRKYFLKPRGSNRIIGDEGIVKGTGVFQGMLSTVGGVVQVPKGIPITNLTDYAYTEIIREFSRETGLSNDELELKEIKALAFSRELARGGKPQFFFLIEIPEITDKNFKYYFKKSPEGLEEFNDHFIDNYIFFSSSLSPETATNLFYSLSYFQNNGGLNPKQIFL